MPWIWYATVCNLKTQYSAKCLLLDNGFNFLTCIIRGNLDAGDNFCHRYQMPPNTILAGLIFLSVSNYHLLAFHLPESFYHPNAKELLAILVSCTLIFSPHYSVVYFISKTLLWLNLFQLLSKSLHSPVWLVQSFSIAIRNIAASTTDHLLGW